ncbi:hypothetical protein Hanom_Chr04g00279831 [Helianthus anomalus]
MSRTASLPCHIECSKTDSQDQTYYIISSTISHSLYADSLTHSLYNNNKTNHFNTT